MITKRVGKLSLTVSNPTPAWVRIYDTERHVEISLHPSEILDLEYLVKVAKRELVTLKEIEPESSVV